MNVSLRRLGTLFPLLTAWLLACGGDGERSAADAITGETSTAGALIGTYTRCTWLAAQGSGGAAFVVNPDSVTIAQQDSSLVAIFTNPASRDAISGAALPATSTLNLSATSATSAQLEGAGQSYVNQWAYCGGGAYPTDAGGYVIADPAPTLATMSATHAEVSSADGLLFVDMEGPLRDIVGSPDCLPDGSNIDSAGSLVCFGHAQNTAAASSRTTRFGAVPGTYTCTGTIGVICGELHENAGAQGSLTLATDGSTVTAEYSGDGEASGTLRFTTTSSATASLVPGQSFGVACSLAANPPQVPTAITSGALMFDGSTVTMLLANPPEDDGGADDLPVWGALTCTPQADAN